jgi:FtsZ-interacting cell division protein YlmF
LQQAASFKQRNARSNRSKKSTKQEKHYSYSRILEATETEKPQSKQKRRARKQPGINQETLQKCQQMKNTKRKMLFFIPTAYEGAATIKPVQKDGALTLLQVLHETRYKQ